MKRKKQKDINLKRINRHALLFNNREKRVIDEYCRKHKIKNKSKFMRESIMATILQDYPSLFEFEEDNTLFKQGK
ncbi:MAG: hypothetical protein KAR20_27800 [Candidatus Heimdallarchaeota archaeon]|nr:hypothetical protein [Candidatus Heimdallarchaeota archaeon]